jgi:hypothetical protein
MLSIEWIDEVIDSWWIVILVMKPSLPAWSNLLNISWEELACVGILNPSPLILIQMCEVLIVSITELICADQRSNFVGEACLLMSWLVNLTSKDGSH